MNNILNAQEAFTALRAGKTVLCRYAGNGNLHADKDFSTLDQMPATVFVLPNYEFCIKLEMIELAGITFTKPLTMDEVQEGQDIFVMQSHGVVYHQKFNREVDGMIESVMGGFAQRDGENAKLQYNAFCKAVGFPTCDIAVIEIGLPKKRGNKSKSTKPIEVDQAANEDTSLDEIIGPVSAQSPRSDTADPELSVLCDAFITEIDAANSEQELKAIRVRVNSNGDLTEVESAELATRLNLKSASFEKEQSTVAFENIAAAAVSKAQEIDEETQQKNSSKSNNDEYQEKLNSLKLRVDESKTPTEVNAVIRYTNDWSEEQRAPLLQYMHKRLEELQQNKAEVAPSLMVRIQNAPDLTELDALEIDVSSLDPVIQPEMMRHVRNRRLELEKTSTAAINDEDLP